MESNIITIKPKHLPSNYLTVNELLNFNSIK